MAPILGAFGGLWFRSSALSAASRCSVPQPFRGGPLGIVATLQRKQPLSRAPRGLAPREPALLGPAPRGLAPRGLAPGTKAAS